MAAEHVFCELIGTLRVDGCTNGGQVVVMRDVAGQLGSGTYDCPNKKPSLE